MGEGDGGETLITLGCERWMRTTGNKKMGDGNFVCDQRGAGGRINMNLPIRRRAESSKWPKVALSVFGEPTWLHV